MPASHIFFLSPSSMFARGKRGETNIERCCNGSRSGAVAPSPETELLAATYPATHWRRRVPVTHRTFICALGINARRWNWPKSIADGKEKLFNPACHLIENEMVSCKRITSGKHYHQSTLATDRHLFRSFQ